MKVKKGIGRELRNPMQPISMAAVVAVEVMREGEPVEKQHNVPTHASHNGIPPLSIYISTSLLLFPLLVLLE
jgi:hypothetical protein